MGGAGVEGPATGATGRVVVWTAAAVVTLVVVLMAWDHLVGNEPGGTDAFPVDPPAFAISMLCTLATAAIVFGVVAPRALGNPSRAPVWAAWLSGAALPLAVVAGWLGFPLVLAGGGVGLGLVARTTGIHSRWATAAIVVGVLVLVYGVLATAIPPPAGQD
jgi:hypothetical protein